MGKQQYPPPLNRVSIYNALEQSANSYISCYGPEWCDEHPWTVRYSRRSACEHCLSQSKVRNPWWRVSKGMYRYISLLTGWQPQGRSWVLESGGSRFQLFGRGWKLAAGENIFWVERCFWCVLANCEIEFKSVIFRVTCLKHIFILDLRVYWPISLANYGFGLTGRKIWLFCCWTNNTVLFISTAYFVHKSTTVTDANITTWQCQSNSSHVMI